MRIVQIVVLGALAGGCGDGGGGGGPSPDGPPEPPPAGEAPKAVYIMSNEADANRIVVFARGGDGALIPGIAYATGGRGTASGLGSQGSLVFDATTHRFFAVNAGDDSISMLSLEADGSLVVRAHVPSGGVHPVSITVAGDVVYTVNAGDAATPANIAGFRMASDQLAALTGSSQPLSAAQPGPAQISFTPDGAHLIVTEKMTDIIDTFAVTDGIAAAPTPQPSQGKTPFGFAFSTGGQLLVSEAFGGMPGLGAVSSYAFSSGAWTDRSASVPSAQSAPCWVVYIAGHAYVTNTASNTVSQYDVADDGMLALSPSDGVAASSGTGPIDADVSDGDGFLYVLTAGDHAINSYAVASDGSLTRRPDLPGIAAAAVGLVAR